VRLRTEFVDSGDFGRVPDASNVDTRMLFAIMAVKPRRCVDFSVGVGERGYCSAHASIFAIFSVSSPRLVTVMVGSMPQGSKMESFDR